MGTLQEYQCAFLIVSRSLLLRMMFQTKFVEKINAHILCSVTFCFENSSVYEITWRNTVVPGRTEMTIPNRNACCIPKATNTHSEYIILISSAL
jgi:hypothetical protein